MSTTAENVLSRLRAASGFVSGEALGRELGLSRAAVWKAVRNLAAMGYRVEAVRRRGYRLQQVGDGAVASELPPLLATRALGRHLLCLDRTESTNAVAKQRAAADAPHGLLVSADHQTKGRGRMQRVWHSPPGRNLYVSLLLRPAVPPARVPQLAIVVAVALRAALAEHLPDLPVRIKWPNDLWIGGRKVCGILCEMEAETGAVHHVVVGVGLNVNTASDELPGDLRETATSLRIAAGREVPRVPLLAAFLNHLEPMLDKWSDAEDLSPFLAAYEDGSLLHGREIRVEQLHGVLVGRAEGIGPRGELLLRTEAGLVGVYSGDAHVRRESLADG